MPYNKKKLLWRSFIAVALLGVFNYLFAHLAYLNMNSDVGLVYEYITLYISKVLGFVIPVAISALAMLIYANEGARASASFTLALSSARVFYYLPYYYIIYIYNYGYDTVESLALSLISSVGVILFTSLFTLITISLSVLILKKQGDNGTALSPSQMLCDSLSRRQEITELTSGANLAFLISSLLSLLCSIIPEIIDTVTFFIEYGFDYTPGEVLTIMGNYLLLFALTVGSYIISSYLRNRFLSSHDDSE